MLILALRSITIKRHGDKQLYNTQVNWGMYRMSTKDDNRKYRISIGAYGSIEVEAPSKEDAIDLFKEVTRTKTSYKLDEAIR